MIKPFLHIAFIWSIIMIMACEKKEITDVIIEEEPQLMAIGNFDNSPFEFIAGRDSCIGETYIIEDEGLGIRFWVFEFIVPKMGDNEILKFSLIEEIPINEPNGPTPDSVLYNDGDLNFSDNDSLFSVPSILIEYSSGNQHLFQSNISTQSEDSYFEIGEPSHVTVNNEGFLMVNINFACELKDEQQSEVIQLTQGSGNIAFRVQN